MKTFYNVQTKQQNFKTTSLKDALKIGKAKEESTITKINNKNKGFKKIKIKNNIINMFF